MKKNIAAFFVLLITFTSQGQDAGRVPELVRMMGAPNSPEAQAFQKYGEVPVNLYTGTPNIAVPLYTIKGRELDLPLSLSYDASGIKVNQLATQVGLGWNLNVGGRISRVVNGLPDDYISSSPAYLTYLNNTTTRQDIIKFKNESTEFSTPQEAEDFLYFSREIYENYIDAQPDYFSLNALGINEMIVIDMETMIAQPLHNPRIRVEPTFDTNNLIMGWKVTLEDATILRFNLAETTRTSGSDQSALPGIIKEYYSSWVLTQVTSPNEKDIYVLGYEDLGFWNQDETGNQFGPHQMQIPSSAGQYNFNNASIIDQSYTIRQQFLKSIQHNGKNIVYMGLKNRCDIDIASALNYMDISKMDGQLLFRYVFNHDYFGESTNPCSRPKEELRLRLVSLDKIGGVDTNNPQSYRFHYSNISAPSRNSLSVDYLGYYNASGNSTIYPKYRIDQDKILHGANRMPNTNAQAFMLERVEYPTGGATTYKYGAHYTPVEYNLHNDYGKVVYASAGVTPSNYYASGNGEENQDGPPNSGNNDSWEGHYTEGWLWDMYGAGEYPNINKTTFRIEEAGRYDFEFISQDNGDPNAASPVTDLIRGSAKLDLATGDYTRGEPLYFDLATIGNSIQLDEGLYTFYMISSHSNIRAEISRQEELNITNMAAGLRILEIKDYSRYDDTEQILASKRTFSYGSSGKLSRTPELHDFSNGDYSLETNQGSYNCYATRDGLITRYAYVSMGEPHVTYSSVYEKRWSTESNESNGYIHHQFHDGDSGIYKSGFPHGTNFYEKNIDTGLPSETTYAKNSNDTIYKTTNTYFEENDFTLTGLFSERDQSRTNTVPIIYQDGSSFRIRYDVLDAGYNPFGPGCSWSPPPQCDDPNNACFSPQLAPFVTKKTLVRRWVTKSMVQERKTFGQGQPIEQVTTSQYDANVDWLLRESQTTNSEGLEERVRYSYPKDHLGEGIYQSMSNANMINTVIAEHSYRNNVLILERDIDYMDHNGLYLPEKVVVKKAGQDGKTTFFDLYDDTGNLVQFHEEGGPTSSILWGYNDQYPVANVNNADYNSVLATGVSRDTINNLTSSENDVKEELEKIRNGLSNALVTSYTYEPSIGISSTTAPTGVESKYFYDNFGRLSYITDAQNHVERKYAYKYGSGAAAEAISLTITGSEGTLIPYTLSLMANVEGGSGHYSYQWSYQGSPIGGNTPELDYTLTSFTGSRNKNIKCEITDLFSGETSTEYFQFYIYPDELTTPVLSVSQAVVSGEVVNFNAGNLYGGSSNYRYEWYIDGVRQNENDSAFSHFFSNYIDATTQYEIKFRLVDKEIIGHYKEVSKTITVHPRITTGGLSASTIHSTINSPINFTATGAGGGSGNLRYQWFVDDVYEFEGDTSFSRSFIASGTYRVKFRVMDSAIFDSFVDTYVDVHVYPRLHTPLLSSDTEVLRNQSVTINASNLHGGSGDKRYEWYIDNVLQSNTGTQLSKTFTSTGTYSVKFKVIDNLIPSHSTERTRTINVYNPIAPGTISTSSIVTVNSNNTFSVNPSGGSGNYSYAWSINGQWANHTSSARSFTLKMNYDYYGSVSVACTITDNQTGESRTLNNIMTVNGSTIFQPSITATYTFVNSNQRFTFTVNTFGNGDGTNGSGHYQYQWIEGITGNQKVMPNAVYLSCNKTSERVGVRVTDTRTGLSNTFYRTVYYQNTSNCNSNGGGGGQDENGEDEDGNNY